MKTKLIGLISLLSLLSACSGSSDMEGVYVCDGMFKMKLELKGNGEGYATVSGNKTTIEYKVDGDNFVMIGNGQTSVLTIEGDVLRGDKTVIGACKPSE